MALLLNYELFVLEKEQNSSPFVTSLCFCCIYHSKRALSFVNARESVTVHFLKSIGQSGTSR